MQNSLLKMFGSVKLVQEVTRSSQSESSSSCNLQDESATVHNNNNNNNIDLENNLLETQKNPVQVTQPRMKINENQNNKLYIHQHDIQELLFSLQPNNIPTPHKARKFKQHTRRFRRHRQSSFRQSEQKKSKSQKLLCLWPLPIVTRYMILISLLVSTLNFFNIVHLSFSVPSFVIYRYDFKNLFLSPFLFEFTLPSMALFGWNVLILGLFEESLTHTIGGTRRFITLLVSLFLFVLGVRNSLGYIFSKSTGWAFPLLFFSNSMHEHSRGLSPFLFALLVVQSLSIDDKYILIYDHENANCKITIHKVLLQLCMCLVNYTKGNIYWWSISGLLTGFVITLILQLILAREKRDDSIQVKDVAEFITLEQYRRTPLWRLLFTTLKRVCMVVGFTFIILRTWNAYYVQDMMVSASDLNAISPQDPHLFTFVFMTAPRRGDPAYLSRTLESYLANWPEHPPADSPYRRMQAIVYTHFTNHSQYDVAKDHFSQTTKGKRYLRWVREEGSDWNQRLHVSKALRVATELYPSAYYALMEDDFPVCGKREWHEIENVIYKAEKDVQNHCGVFVGTGGSGLFLKPDTARLAAELLLKYAEMPPDIIIQKCLMGELPECAVCRDTLVTSKTLLMYHIGYNTSTSDDRVYRKDEFQCGWRHPFNGDPSVITL